MLTKRRRLPRRPEATAAPKRGVTQRPANHSVHQPQECTHYRAAFAFSVGELGEGHSRTQLKNAFAVFTSGQSAAKNRTIKR